MIPSGGITLELMWNKAGQSLGISPAPESRQLALLWGGGEGSGGVIITYLCPSCLQSCWWEVGPRVGPQGLGRACSVPSQPLQLAF